MQPLVSIIIPLYNRSTIIGETIESLLQQTYPCIEIIVVDDQSTDQSYEIAKAYETTSDKITVIRRKSSETKGANACRNIGLSIAKGQYVKWIDSDDLLHVHTIQMQVEDIIQSESDISICRARKFTQGSNTIEREWLGEWGKIDDTPTIANFCAYQFIWHTCAGLWNIDFVKKSEKWDIELLNSQEWLFHLTSLANGAIVSTLNEFGCFVRMHHDSMSYQSNKKGKYYFNECLARYKAMNILNNKNHKEFKSYHLLFKKFKWYHLFTFYKGSFHYGIKLLALYPRLFHILISIRKRN